MLVSRHRPLLLRVLWTAAICGSFAASLAYTLSTRVPDILDRATPAWPHPTWQSVHVPLLETAGPSPPEYVLFLEIEDPLAVLAHDEVRILFVTADATRAHLTSATLEMVGTPCIYEAPLGATLAHGKMLPFVRGPGCYVLRAQPRGAWKLIVRLTQRNRIGLVTLQLPKDAKEPQAIKVVGIPGHSEFLLLVNGRYINYLPATATRRIDLLAHMWQVRDSVRWIWAAIAVATGLLWAGMTVIPYGSASAARSGWAFAARSAAGSGAMAAAFGLCYAVLVPPFQAADESNHFLGYGEVVDRPEIAIEAAKLAALGHFDRLRFRADEHFRPIDMGSPLSVSWAESATSNVTLRSSNVRLWRLFDPFSRHQSPERTLVGLRFLNTGVFALAVAVGTLAAVLLTTIPFPQLLAFSFLFVPSIPFFATYVSNYATLTSAYVLFAFGVAITTLGRGRDQRSGFMLGLGAGLALVISRSALPMALFLVFVLIGRLLATSPPFETWRNALRSAVGFWGSLSLGLAIPFLLAPAEYKTLLAVWIALFLPALAGGWEWLGSYAWWLLAAILLVGVVAEVNISRGRAALGDRLMSQIVRCSRIAPLLMAALLAGLMFVSIFVRFPILQPVGAGARPAVPDYLGTVMLSTLGFFRLRHADHLLSSSFWAGFGWLDTIPPDWFICTLGALTGAALIGLLLHVRANREAVHVVILTVAFAGFVATLMAYAFITLSAAPDLHGRYLVGLYLCILPICWSLPALKAANADSLWRFRSPVLFAMCPAVHAYSLSFILHRYF